MKYRLTRDDGVEIDVPGVVWESTLARAYRNGWKPAGTAAPARQGGRWAESDYFSTSSQHVREADALELGTAVIDPLAAEGPDPTGIQRVGAFARRGGFTIGRAPEGPRSSPSR